MNENNRGTEVDCGLKMCRHLSANSRDIEAIGALQVAQDGMIADLRVNLPRCTHYAVPPMGVRS
jgi:hypothetical protein